MTRNLPASVHDRLVNHAHQSGETAELVFHRYATERFLYRLSLSSRAQQFVLKGANVFLMWQGAPHRPTRDLDLLGPGGLDQAAARAWLREVCSTLVDDDALVFDAEGIEMSSIMVEQDDPGLRATIPVTLGRSQLRVTVDLSFGQSVYPEATVGEFPVILPGLPAPKLLTYPPETVVAEKFEAIVKLGMANSRMKDFYDLHFIAQTFSFECMSLAEAIRRTFEHRRTALPDGVPTSLTPAFLEDGQKRSDWDAFLRRSIPAGAPSLPEVGALIAGFVLPAVRVARDGTGCAKRWGPAGGWYE